MAHARGGESTHHGDRYLDELENKVGSGDLPVVGGWPPKFEKYHWRRKKSPQRTSPASRSLTLDWKNLDSRSEEISGSGRFLAQA
jgi:hypothetical protein